ncbi:dynein beta chain, ciliary-like [Bemisia tabaci]|uniref:dynein beta chain, ciliary-like n=1 Tax=Bemisia tabaci TaxID=7038 RepID=UPI003B28BBC6
MLEDDSIESDLSTMWLSKGVLKAETESLIVAAQDQALNTRYRERKIHKQLVNEFRLWSKRLHNLENIYSQLKDPRIKTMTSILQLTNSAYLPCFKSLFKGVVAAVHEANEINSCIKVLVLQVNRFDEIEDFLEAEKQLPAIMHTLCLIWAHCKYFNSSSKLINILFLISNMLITKARKYLNPATLFQIDLEETAPIIAKTIQVLYNFKKLFEFCRRNLHTYFPKNTNHVSWLFDWDTVFKRFNSFIQRLEQLQILFSTSIEYNKLEKVEIGGVLGRHLSGKVNKMFLEFQLIIRRFQQLTYDPTDIDDHAFVIDYSSFLGRVVDIDRRLASILNQAVSNCHNLQQFLKLMYVVGTLMERPIIFDEIIPKCTLAIDMLSEELDDCLVSSDSFYLKIPLKIPAREESSHK